MLVGWLVALVFSEGRPRLAVILVLGKKRQV
jgi:hypothetical protein